MVFVSIVASGPWHRWMSCCFWWHRLWPQLLDSVSFFQDPSSLLTCLPLFLAQDIQEALDWHVHHPEVSTKKSGYWSPHHQPAQHVTWPKSSNNLCRQAAIRFIGPWMDNLFTALRAYSQMKTPRDFSTCWKGAEVSVLPVSLPFFPVKFSWPGSNLMFWNLLHVLQKSACF